MTFYFIWLIFATVSNPITTPSVITSVTYIDLASHEMAIGNYEMAYDLARKELIKNPNQPRSYTLLGNYYFHKKEFQKALLNYDKAKELEILTNQPALIDTRLPALAHVRLAEKAVPKFQLWNIGGAFPRPKRVNSALEHLQAALEWQPDFEEVHLLQGLLLYWNNDLDEAKQSFLKVIEINPANKKAKKCLIEIEQFENAKQVNLTIVESKPQPSPKPPVISAIDQQEQLDQVNYGEFDDSSLAPPPASPKVSPAAKGEDLNRMLEPITKILYKFIMKYDAETSTPAENPAP